MMRWIRSLLWLSLAAVPFVTAVAQRPAPPAPAPRANPTPQARPCDECAALEELRAKEELLHAEMDRLYNQALDARETLREQDDSAARRAYRQSISEYNASRSAYNEAVRKLMRVEIEFAQKVQRLQWEKARAGPKGWFGIYFSGEAKMTPDKNGHQLTLWLKYPLIESVEPDSPAEKAGIESSDLLIAIDGSDVTKVPVSFFEILVPGRHVTMKVRHGRTTVDRVVVVEKKPYSFGESWSTPRAAAPMVAEAPEAPEAPEPPEAERGWRTPLPPMPKFAPVAPTDVTVSVWYDDMTIAGARIQRFSALKEYFGVDSGVLVLSVGPGTPAARAGLRDGDVITRAGGKTVTDPGRLSRLLEQSRGNSLALEIVRQRKQQSIVLKW